MAQYLKLVQIKDLNENKSMRQNKVCKLFISSSVSACIFAQLITNVAYASEQNEIIPTNTSSEITKSKPKPMHFKPGMELSISTNTEDLVPTDDLELARKQVNAYPDSPEASFILAVALTRTSRVEEALQEVRRARKLAEQKGGTSYFDKMIQTYEDMLKNFPDENRVRYGLAWAYYMKAYLLANYSRKVAAWKAANGDPKVNLAEKATSANNSSAANTVANNKTSSSINKSETNNSAAKNAVGISAASNSELNNSAITSAVSNGPANAINNVNENVNKDKINSQELAKNQGTDLSKVLSTVGNILQGNTNGAPRIPSLVDKVDPQDVPSIRKYYELAIEKLDDLLKQKADDVWAIVYRAHLKGEYTGNLSEAMQTWLSCREKFPNNPAAYFFLGEGYLKQGNLKESINNVSRAVALRAMGY